MLKFWTIATKVRFSQNPIHDPYFRKEYASSGAAPRAFLELSNFGRTRRLGEEEKRKKKEVEQRERERERERKREPRETQSILRTCPECQSSKPPQKEYKNRAREARLGSRGSVSQQGDRDRAKEKGEGHGNYFRTVKPARREGDVSRHPRVKGYLAE